MYFPNSIIAAGAPRLFTSPICPPIGGLRSPFDSASDMLPYVLEALASAQKEQASLQQRLDEAEKAASPGMSAKKNEQDYQKKIRWATLIWTMQKELLRIRPLLPIGVEGVEELKRENPNFKIFEVPLGSMALRNSLNRLYLEDEDEKQKKGKRRSTTLQLAIELASVLEGKEESTMRSAWKSHAQFVRGRKQPVRNQTLAKKTA